MTEAQSPDAMKSLVIFMIKLAVLGVILAVAWYYLVELPRLAALAPPPNGTVFF
jgi:hypothetical protein